MRTIPLPKIIVAALAIAGALSSTAAVAQQSYPTRTVRIVVGYAPGTGIDVVARIMADALSKSMGQPFVVEQRVGAAGTIAAATVASAPPDGYSILIDSSSHSSVPSVMPGLPFDTARDFIGVTTLVENPLVMVTSKTKGYKNIAELVAAGKSKPGSLNYASGGVATSTHISAEKFRQGAGFQATHVPFKSTTEAMTEMIGGRIDFTYTALTTALGGIRDGRLVPLAMSMRRTKLLPDLPTIAEAGYPKAAYSSWIGMMVASKTPPAIVARLHEETLKALASPEVQEKLAKIGAEPATLPQAEFDSLRVRDLAENDRIVKSAGISR